MFFFFLLPCIADVAVFVEEGQALFVDMSTKNGVNSSGVLLLYG